MKYILVVILMLFSSQTVAQEMMCMPTEKLFAGLTGAYGEHQVWAGLTNESNILTLFAKNDEKEGKSFSMVYSMPTGISCLVQQGSEWAIEGSPKMPKAPKKGK